MKSDLVDSCERPLSTTRIRSMLRLPKKLAPAPLVPVRLGSINGVEIWDLGQCAPGAIRGARRPHRLHAKLNGRFIPCGRIHQARGVQSDLGAYRNTESRNAN